MKFEIYHQLGHQYKWNLESLRDDNAGDGIIIAPRFIECKKVLELKPEISSNALFDPQFFLPDIPKGKLLTYDFFPDVVASGFETDEYAASFAVESAKKCIEFQEKNNFRSIVIPTRYLSGMPTDFIESQQKLFIEPFLGAIASQGITRKVTVQLVLNDNMVKDKEYSSDILNWVTGIPNIGSVYVIVEVAPRAKQIKDIDFLYSFLNFIHALSQNGLEVILGYLNTEALLLSIASPQVVTIGSYERTRMFNVRAFRDLENEGQQGPNPRLYISKLIQSIDFRYINAIKRALPEDVELFDQNKYQALMFEPSYRWHFSKPELYKHYFLEFSKQLRSLSNLAGAERYNAVCSMIETARSYYTLLSDGGVVFDSDSDGSHLAAWLTAANQFANQQGWR